MKRIGMGLLLAALATGVALDATQAGNPVANWWHDDRRPDEIRSRDKSFQRVGTLANYLQYPSNPADVTISEIISATADGKTLVYTDGERGTAGFIDITDPGNPQPLGTTAFDPNPGDDIDYSPSSVDVLGNRYALVAVNTSESLTNTSGILFVVDIPTRTTVTQIALGGQPDSVKISPDGSLAAIVIENERNENLCVGGTLHGTEADEDDCVAGGGVPGGLPQTEFGNPAGFLAVLKITGDPSTWGPVSVVTLTGLATYAPGDPEPEFADINDRNEAVVSLQENNHLVVVDLPTLKVKEHFGAGAVTLKGVDATDDDLIKLEETVEDVVREPDAVAWIPVAGGTYTIATANEGDLFGGSRGFSIFHRNGSVLFDSKASLEALAVQHGHYPDGRSDNKGTEPESVAFAKYHGEDYLFVGTERGNFVAVYTLNPAGHPTFEQFLPGPLGPEGLLTIPQRNLLVTSGEVDLPTSSNLVRSTVMIYELKRGEPTYPQILSDDRRGSPIPWSALSGLVSIPWRSDSLLAVWDGFYRESNVFRIDVSKRPVVIEDVVTLKGGSGSYDAEGIAIAPDNTLWIAVEGNASDSVQNRLIKADANGNVVGEFGLPPLILSCRAASSRRGTLGSGFEGVAVLRSPSTSDYKLLVAQQRGWDYTSSPECEALDDDGGGLNASNEPNWSRLWIFDARTNIWEGAIAWQLAPKPAGASWVGLSEISETPEGDYILIERDNRSGDFGVLKTLAKVNRTALGDRFVSTSEKAVYDLMPHLLATNGWITDKPEGVAVTSTGQTYVVTDNDGVDNWSGETWFFSLGRYWQLF